MKAYTDVSQSKILAEFLPLESADMYYEPPMGFCTEPSEAKFGDIKYAHPRSIRCWSLAALMNLLPSEFTEKGKYSETTYKIHIRKYALTDDVDVYQIAYGNYKIYEDGHSSWKDMVNTGEKEDLLDAAFQMICWLKENGKI
jgi:hypothetical protein